MKRTNIGAQARRAFDPKPHIKTASPDTTRGMDNLQVGFNVIPDAAEVARQDEMFNTIKSKDGRTMREVWNDWYAGKG